MYIDEAFWTVDTMFYSEMKIPHCAKYIFFAIKDIDFTRWDSGTGVPSMTASTLYNLLMIKPIKDLLKKFDMTITPIFYKVKQIRVESEELAKQRDELLPLLMNGQVSVNSIVFENEHNREFVYFALKLYFENAKGKTGNVFANMSKDEFASIKMVYPPKQILQGFHNKVVAIFDNIKNNIGEINALTKQRDELLPLLMNGQAMVNSDLSDD